ncbi:hypothetical protein GRX01_10975 [Halobaculum sp. WSA2]|uniref:Uncharacterized protein n=1 Tax=Halobaculum saliterrae TaxID=2073113 RepID=A0A6B0SWE4_9EURY|nr:hypothetical protein [Halobaculum saliterrae]MXR41856.1 hypothetical protein [Halobaculum saliterrae]
MVAGTVSGTAEWSRPRATHAEVTVGFGTDDTTVQVRSVTTTVANRTELTLANALVDTRLQFLTAGEADDLSVAADGRTRTYDRTVTVTVTLYAGDQDTETVAADVPVEIVVTNEPGNSEESGGSNAGAT